MLYEPVHHVLTGSYVTVNDDVFHKRGVRLNIQNQTSDFIKVILSYTQPLDSEENYIILNSTESATFFRMIGVYGCLV